MKESKSWWSDTHEETSKNRIHCTTEGVTFGWKCGAVNQKGLYPHKHNQVGWNDTKYGSSLQIATISSEK